MKKRQEQDTPSIMQRIKASVFESDIEVLDDYYQQVNEKTEGGGTVKKESNIAQKEIAPQTDAGSKKAVTPTNKEVSITPPSDVDALFLKAARSRSQAMSNLSQPAPTILNRDPFAITEEMVSSDAKLQASLNFLPDEKPKFTIPTMKMKGLVMGEDGEYAAVIDIEGYGPKVVRKGDTIGLQGSGDEAAIRIK